MRACVHALARSREKHQSKLNADAANVRSRFLQDLVSKTESNFHVHSVAQFDVRFTVMVTYRLFSSRSA